ncbi:gp9 [Clostridioides difficile]|nr:gp9 [Clostridioides difficile]
MAKFKKKPVEVETFRLGYDIEPEWFIGNSRVCNFMQEKCIDGNVSCDLETLEGTMRANKGDYIIQGVKGEIYPCKADIFEMTYEKVEYRGKNKLSTEMTLDSTNFQENIKNAAKELNLFIEVLEKADDKIDKLTEKMNKCACKVDIDKIVKQLSESLRESIE